MRLLLLILAIALSPVLYGQHCPYDGANLVAVKLVDQKGRLINPAGDTVYLVEINNPLAGSCTYAPGALKLPLKQIDIYLAECSKRYGPGYSKTLLTRFKEKGVIDNANLVVSINQPERYCMIKDSSDFVFKDRTFAISYYHDQKQITVPVLPADIRSLCTASANLDDFKPIVVRVF